MVFIANSSCKGINDPELPTALARIRYRLGRRAAANGAVLVSIGVSSDLGAERGLKMLEKFGPFDEVMSGHGWLNSGTIKYMWQELPGAPIIPQVVVLEREVKQEESSAINNERVLFRKIGDAIIEWSKQSSELDRNKPRDGHRLR